MPWDPTPEHARTWLLPSDIAKLYVLCGRDCTMPDRVARELLDISGRVYSKLLSLYPARHRREYGSLMAQLFRDQMRDAYGQNGVRGRRAARGNADDLARCGTLLAHPAAGDPKVTGRTMDGGRRTMG